MQSPSLLITCQLLRVQQYVKNTFCFLPVFFAGKMTDGPAVLAAAVVFFAFCFTSSAIYIINDLRDLEEDRTHPVKKFRPLASGKISPGNALAFAMACMAAGCTIAYFFSGLVVLLVILAYICINLAYSFFAKKISIVDVTCIAAGFVLRVVGGSIVVSHATSPWLVLQTFLLCMALALGKRWDDLKLSKDGRLGTAVRPNLAGYSEHFITSAMNLFATISCVCYIIYSLSPQTQEHYRSEMVYLTSGWVILGVTRYLQLALVEHKSGSPTNIFLRDRFIYAVIAGWAIHLSVLLYWDKFRCLL